MVTISFVDPSRIQRRWDAPGPGLELHAPLLIQVGSCFQVFEVFNAQPSPRKQSQAGGRMLMGEGFGQLQGPR